MTANASSNLTPPWLPSSLSSSASAQQMTTTTGSWWTVGGEGGGGGGNGSHLSPMSSSLVTSLYGILSPSSNGGSTLPLNSIAASLSAASSTLSMGTEGAVSSTVPTTTSTLAADGLITTLTTLVSGDPNCTVSSIISTASMSPDYEQEQQDHNIYIMPLFTQIIWSFIFGSMIFVAAGGNIIVIWIVLTHKRMRTVTNYFLVNLSLADTMVALLNVLENFIYMLNGDWPFGEVYCKVSNFVAILSVAASVFTLMAISIDRYLAIVHPLRPRMSRTMTLNIIVCIWICSSLLSLPNIIYSTTLLESFRNGDSRVICYLEWYDGPSTKSRMEYIYNILILLVTYMLPIVSMSYTYFRVGKELWGSQSIGECTAKQMESIKSKRKIVKMMMIVVAIFGICWFPYHVYFLLAHHYPSIVSSEYAQHTYLSIYWLAMSNSMYNPFVYCWMNSRFRQGFKNIFCCTCLRQKDQNMFDKPRYHGAARYSCASEACTTDMRVRFNGNGNITLQATSATDAPGTTGSSATSPLQSKFTFSREML